MSINPDANESLRRLKEETAKELGIASKVSSKSLNDIPETIFNAGKVGGNMTKKLIEIAEKDLVNKRP